MVRMKLLQRQQQHPPPDPLIGRALLPSVFHLIFGFCSCFWFLHALRFVFFPRTKTKVHYIVSGGNFHLWKTCDAKIVAFSWNLISIWSLHKRLCVLESRHTNIDYRYCLKCIEPASWFNFVDKSRAHAVRSFRGWRKSITTADEVVALGSSWSTTIITFRLLPQFSSTYFVRSSLCYTFNRYPLGCFLMN